MNIGPFESIYVYNKPAATVLEPIFYGSIIRKLSIYLPDHSEKDHISSVVCHICSEPIEMKVGQ